MKRILGFVVIGCVGSLVWAAGASAAAGDVTCNGTAPASVTNDLIVPAGTTCTINAGSKVGYDVLVNKGATLLDFGGQVGHNITATSPAGVSIFGGTTSDGTSTFYRAKVGNDVHVDGVTGSASPSTNYVCTVDIVHDLVLTNSAATAGEWLVGDTPELCGQQDTVGHDVVITNNKNPIEVSDIYRGGLGNFSPPSISGYGIGHDLRVNGNAQAPVVEANTVFHDAVCQSNWTTDTPNEEPSGVRDFPNVSGHINTCD